MLRSPRAWMAAVLLAVALHLDWHLGRPGHHADLSFAWPLHWLMAVPVFAGLWSVARRQWPRDAVRMAAVIVVLGALLGQGLEPLAETLIAPADAPFANRVRWRVFAEFMGAGLATLGVLVLLARREREAGGAAR